VIFGDTVFHVYGGYSGIVSELWRYQGSKTYSKGLLIGSVSFSGSAMGTSESSMWFLSALSDSFALRGSWVAIVEMFISRGILGVNGWMYIGMCGLYHDKSSSFPDWFLMIPKSFFSFSFRSLWKQSGSGMIDVVTIRRRFGFSGV
jgi:hypothetical protein